jgi:hypothetical protein
LTKSCTCKVPDQSFRVGGIPIPVSREFFVVRDFHFGLCLQEVPDTPLNSTTEDQKNDPSQLTSFFYSFYTHSMWRNTGAAEKDKMQSNRDSNFTLTG